MFLTQLLIYYVCLNIINGQNWRQQRPQRPQIRIQQGVLEGNKVVTDSGKRVSAYLGIPYAQAPIRDLRFAPPKRHMGWNETLQATKFASHCPQLPIKPGMNDQEDCLYLNIWTPENIASYAPLPVVIVFEGKDFYQSSSIPINGQDLASEELVVITINYRLNLFGFFCLGTPEARGNLGLLDQYFAMLWIKENVKQFGGDPEKTTLFGHGSGAASVTLHMVSPRTSHFFQRVIVTSGSAVAPWQMQNNPIVASRQIIRILGCDTYTVNSLACLRGKNVEDLLQALAEYSESFNWNDRFLPVVDTFLPMSNRYLPVDPAKVLREGTFPQIPILTGVSKPITDEQFMQWLELASQGYPQLQQYTEKAKIPEILRLYKFNPTIKEKIFDIIKWKYFSSNQGKVRLLFDELKDLEFQSKVEAPFFLQLSYLVTSYVQPIYVYALDDIGFVVNSTDSIITTDLLLLFGPILLRQVARRRFNSNEINLSKRFKQYWTNFVAFGNPTPNHQAISWRKYTTSDPYVENFELPLSNDEEKRIERVMFWNQLLPKIADTRSFASNNIPRELQNSPDPAAGFRNAMYTLVALVIALLTLLVVCIFLLKKRSRERESQLHMGSSSTILGSTYNQMSRML